MFSWVHVSKNYVLLLLIWSMISRVRAIVIMGWDDVWLTLFPAFIAHPNANVGVSGKHWTSTVFSCIKLRAVSFSTQNIWKTSWLIYVYEKYMYRILLMTRFLWLLAFLTFLLTCTKLYLDCWHAVKSWHLNLHILSNQYIYIYYTSYTSVVS